MFEPKNKPEIFLLRFKPQNELQNALSFKTFLRLNLNKNIKNWLRLKFHSKYQRFRIFNLKIAQKYFLVKTSR